MSSAEQMVAKDMWGEGRTGLKAACSAGLCMALAAAGMGPRRAWVTSDLGGLLSGQWGRWKVKDANN